MISDIVIIISQGQDAWSVQETGQTCLWWRKIAPLMNSLSENRIILSLPHNSS